jgi:hypothetical protein
MKTSIERTFTPFNLKIRVETEEELNLLRELFGANYSVSKAAFQDSVFNNNVAKIEKLDEMLKQLFNELFQRL